MSFREKIAWVCMLTTVAVYVPYFGHIYRLFVRGELNAGSTLWALIGAIVVQAILATAGGIAIAVAGAIREPRDERDAAIHSRSYRNAYMVLITACGLAALGTFALALAPSAGRPEPAAIAQVLLLCFVVAEAARYLTQAVSYRRGV